VEQLQYGMMLPSGNDAAYALAEHFGGLLFHRKFQKQGYANIKLKVPYNSQFKDTDIKYFLHEMNE